MLILGHDQMNWQQKSIYQIFRCGYELMTAICHFLSTRMNACYFKATVPSWELGSMVCCSPRWLQMVADTVIASCCTQNRAVVRRQCGRCRDHSRHRCQQQVLCFA